MNQIPIPVDARVVTLQLSSGLSDAHMESTHFQATGNCFTNKSGVGGVKHSRRLTSCPRFVLSKKRW